MLGFFKRLLGSRQPAVLPGEARGADVLEFIGVNAIIHSWALWRREGLEALWEACPRADWLLEIAHRAGLPIARLERAVGSLPLQLADRSWANLDELLDAVTPALDRLVDEDPRHEQLRAGLPPALPDFLQSDGDPVDPAVLKALSFPEELHAEYASAVRGEIPYRELRDALWGQPATGPYR
jgi:hypothetical protein